MSTSGISISSDQHLTIKDDCHTRRNIFIRPELSPDNKRSLDQPCATRDVAAVQQKHLFSSCPLCIWAHRKGDQGMMLVNETTGALLLWDAMRSLRSSDSDIDPAMPAGSLRDPPCRHISRLDAGRGWLVQR